MPLNLSAAALPLIIGRASKTKLSAVMLVEETPDNLIELVPSEITVSAPS